MTPGPRMRATARRRPPPPPGPVIDLVRARIEQALATRQRYQYVRPRVEREGQGWKIVSPNCSRNIDREGGDIAIAWLVPAHAGEHQSRVAAQAGLGQSHGRAGTWLLHARDHAHGVWRLEGEGLTLAQALQRVCEDPLRVYWP